jgi:UDP-2,3-diacylglucosamine pyrophosphatase LpxH
MAVFRLIAVSAFAVLSGGCIVVSLQPAYTDDAIVFEEGLIGQWENAEDRTAATIERAEWRAYKIVYTDRSTTLAFHANLTRIGETLFLDLTQVRGVDEGPYLVPVHGIYRIAFEADEFCASSLDYQWFTHAMAPERMKRVAALLPAFDGRRNVALGAATGPLRDWLARAPDAVFATPMTFTRKR